MADSRRHHAQGGARAPEDHVRPGRSGRRLRGPHSRVDGRAGRYGRARRAATRAERRAAERPRGLHRQPEAREAARPAAGLARRGRDRLGPGRGARLREPARRGHPGAPHGPGHRAGHVLAPPPRPARRPERAGVRPDSGPGGGDRLLRDPQLAALGRGLPRLRVRLLGGRARGARRLGGAVRRLRQRRRGGDRPVHRLRPLQVGPDLTSDAAAPARLRGQRPRALERAAGAIPPARRAGEHPDRQLHDRRAVLPPDAPAGARPERAAAGRDDAEGPAAPEAGGLDAGRPRRGLVQAGAR